MPTPKTRARKSRATSVREVLAKAEKSLLDADDEVEDGVEEGSEEGEHDDDAEPEGDAFEDDDDDDSQPGNDGINLADTDGDEDEENGDLDAPENGGDDDDAVEDLEEKRDEPHDDHDEPKQGPEEDGAEAASKDDDEDMLDEDEDETSKSRRLISSMRKSLNHLAGMHRSSPSVRKEALLAKAMGGTRLSEAECTQLDRLNRGLSLTAPLRHKVNKGSKLTPALQKAHTSNEGFRALANNLAKSHGALADEVEAARDSSQAQNLALAKGIRALGELSMRTAERQDELVDLLNKAMRQPMHAPRSAGVGYIDKALGGAPAPRTANPARIQKALQEMAKANPLRASEMQLAEYHLALNGSLPEAMQPQVADHIRKSRDSDFS